MSKLVQAEILYVVLAQTLYYRDVAEISDKFGNDYENCEIDWCNWN